MTFSVRPPTLEDAAALLALMTERDIAAIGVADTTMDDVLSTLRDPSIDLSHDGWVSVDSSGRIVGCAFTQGQSTTDFANLDMYADPSVDALATPLWELAEGRAVEIARGLGHPQVIIDVAAVQIHAAT